MKKSILLLLMMFYHALTIAQNRPQNGMQFFTGSWDELLKTAQRENKMIFVDVYTDWCGPCKEMEKFVFTLQEVGNKYNPIFINYKLNAEKGEGKEIAKKFNVSVYPTFLYLNSGGYLAHRVIGEKEPAAFNKIVDEVVKSSENNSLSNMETQFLSGNRDLAFLRTYISKLTELDVDNSVPLDAYFNVIPFQDLKKEETLLFLGQNIFGTQTSSFLFFMENYTLLSKVSKDRVQARLYSQLVDKAAPAAVSQKRFLELQQLLSYISKINPLTEKQTLFLTRVKLIYYHAIRDTAHLKIEGYSWIHQIKPISMESIRAEDTRRYKEFITPFLNGTRDSTRYAEFQDEKAIMRISYAKGIAYNLYYPASLFVALPETDKKALNDALQWANKAQLLDPKQKVYADLVLRLKERLGLL